MEFYTGGGKRASASNVDARNLLAESFLGRAPSVPPPLPYAQHQMHPPPYHYYNDNYRSTSGSHSRRSRRRYYSDSSDYSTPEKKKKRSKSARGRDYDCEHDGKNKSSLINID